MRLVLLFLCTLTVSTSAQAQWWQYQWALMGTAVELEFYTVEDGDELAEQVRREFIRLEQLYSPYIETSLVSEINRLGVDRSIALDDESWFLLDKAQHYARLSQGAFDISFASVGFLYRYREHQAPTSEQRHQALNAVDYRAIELDAKQRSLRFSKPNMRIDLGGIAKGYAVDRAFAILKQQGVKHAWLSAGGDSRVMGEKHNSAWMIGIKHPRKQGQYALKIPLSDTAFSTSGDYERFFIDADGKRQHHILNPVTGTPAKGLISVTVLADKAVDADALSTTAFILGEARALALIDQLAGVDAILINASGKVSYSQGLMPAKS